MTTPAMPARMAAWLDRAWLTRYLDRELEDAEVAWFEAYVLDKPDLLAEIDVDTRLRNELVANPALAPTLRGNDSSATSSATVMHRRRLRHWRAAAAILFCTTGIGALTVLKQRNDQAPDLILAPTTVVYQTMRAMNTDDRQVEAAATKSPYVYYEIAIPPSAQNVTLQLGDAPAMQTVPNNNGFVTFLANRTVGERKATLRFQLAGREISKEIALEAR